MNGRLAVIDDQRLAALCGGNAALEAELLADLLADADPIVAAIRTAGAGEDIHAAAHALKGIAGNVGASRLWAAAQALEETARASGALGSTVAAVEAELAALRAAVAGRG